MSYRIDGTTIYLTRGDTFEAKVEARLPDDEGGRPMPRQWEMPSGLR